MGKLVFNYFHQNRIDLDREIKEHPELQALLDNHPADEFEIRLAEVARYCDIILHGDYIPSDLDRLCGILHKRLYAKRSMIIIQSPRVKEPTREDL